MKKLSDFEQQLFLQLIKSCEYYHLNEKQSIECINKILNINISIRTYYIYKRKLYSHDVFNRLKESIYSSPIDRSAILFLSDDADSKVRTKANKLIADQFPNMTLSPLQPPYYADNNENQVEKPKDTFLADIRKIKETYPLSNDKLNFLPKNVTFREEFVKCGKEACNLCPHGPYYYTYWKDKTNNIKSKLRKKYLGVLDPRY
ncbi:MAG: hypothetical protein WKF36_11185 [Candidatus Nitrosocosmicus sp.]